MMTFSPTLEGINHLLKIADESNDPVVIELQRRAAGEPAEAYTQRLNAARLELLHVFGPAVRDPLNGEPRMVMFFSYDALEELRNHSQLLSNIKVIHWHNLCLDPLESPP